MGYSNSVALLIQLGRSMEGGRHADYGYIWQLAPSGLAWEYLRRNDEYRQDCQTMALIRRQDAERLESFAHRWGLLFPK